MMVLLVEKVAESMGIEVKPRHIGFESDEAQDFGKTVGRKVGTAKHVSKACGIDVDWDTVYEVISQKKQSLRPNYRPADTWSMELDRLLMPCTRVADSLSYLMTPILIIDDKVVHHGCVPSEQQVISWLSE
jgi:hypothetical protein